MKSPGRSRQSYARGAAHYAAKLTPETVREIVTRYSAREGTTRALAKEYGVNQSSIMQVLTGRSWVQVTGIGIKAKTPRLITFLARRLPTGGFVAKAVGFSIVTQADDVIGLHVNARDAARCHFGNKFRGKVCFKFKGDGRRL